MGAQKDFPQKVLEAPCVDGVEFGPFASASLSVVDLWVGKQQSPELDLALRVSSSLRQADCSRIVTKLPCILSDLQREIDERGDYSERTNEFADVPEFLESQAEILRCLTDRALSCRAR